MKNRKNECEQTSYVVITNIQTAQRIEWFWRETASCKGDEARLDDCSHKINYNLPACMQLRRYVYLRWVPGCVDRWVGA